MMAALQKIPVRISWIDSANQPSHIHLTADGRTTLCDKGGDGHAEYITGRTLAKSPRKTAGRSNYCGICCKLAGKKAKKLPWDSRCIEVDWQGPATAPHAVDPRFAGKDNQGKLKTEYVARVAAMDDKKLYDETKHKIWLSAFAANNPHSDYHWHVDAIYDQWSKRGKLEQYDKAFKEVERNA